ncbi:ABC transporter permease [Butyrivibrio sp. WCD3002]|uniref:ABC transporter permease n=1 Tax=Butyrivibrio sp. WCD3002 TaxID=1280676 RepID=UPI00041EC7E9|nr:ABC transporter permease [Butyrivibrio sp. WCD3002]
MSKFLNGLKDRIKHLRLSQIIYVVIVLLLIITIGVLNVVKEHIADSIYDQNEGSRWSNDIRCGQVSLIFSEDANVSADKIQEYEYNINKGIIADGYQDGSASKQTGDAVWNDCYSAMGSVTVTRDKRSVDAFAVGIGGDFFQFHPMKILSGNYINSDSLMTDYVMLDEDLAWQLFGSVDIVGMQVMIKGVPHYIAGVVKRDSGKFVKQAGLNFPTIYLSYQSLATYGTIDSSVLATDNTIGSITVKKKDDEEDANGESDLNTESKGIICMEVVMPNPVDNYAKDFLIKKLSLNTNIVEVVDNSARYENKNLIDVLGSFNKRAMQIKPIIYPYWENNARAYENILAYMLLIQFICGIVSFIMIAIMVVQSYRHRKWRAGQIWTGFLDWKYDMESRVKYHNDKWKHF